jgi:hypothetical protein
MLNLCKNASLTTPKVALFLGAGASQFAGYFTFRTFDRLLLSPHVRAKQGLHELAPDIQRFLEEVRQALLDISRPTTHDNYLWLLNNYRDFCIKFKTHAGVQHRFRKIDDQILPFSDTIKNVMDEITHTTLHHYAAERSPSEAKEVREFYLRVAQINFSHNSHLPVFTTNYDLLLETLLCCHSQTDEAIPLITGIPDCTREGAQWNSELFSQSKLGIQLYRLHGSVAWFYHGAPDPNIYFHRNSADQDWKNNLCVMFPGREIFPGKNPHGHAFRKLHHTFLSSSVIVFIGFSFRDDDVVHSLLAANAARHQPVKIIVADPYLNQKDVIDTLKDSTTRMTFPYLMPDANQMRFLDIEFGKPESCDLLLHFIEKELEDA